jgi:hypothetical protein
LGSTCETPIFARTAVAAAKIAERSDHCNQFMTLSPFEVGEVRTRSSVIRWSIARVASEAEVKLKMAAELFSLA